MKWDVKTFVQRSTKLPSLPSLYYELVQATQDPNASIAEISSILRRDQSLVSRLLRLANSVFYGLPTAVGTLEEAVQLIGLREIQNLVLATTVIKAFDKLPTRLVDVMSFWKHSIACGMASALLAEQRHDPLPERFFVGGLLHDIGRLVLFINAPLESQEILRRCEREAELAHKIEREVIGFDHATLGTELVSYWKLPHVLGEMVGGHHNTPGSTSALADAFLVHYADFITSTLEYGNSGELFVAPLVVPPRCQSYLLEEDQIEFLISELDKQCDDIFPILATAERP
jgi:HD-like signal output (HDOD) protein